MDTVEHTFDTESMKKDSTGGIEASSHHCWRMVSGDGQAGPTTCSDEVVWAGSFKFEDGETWLVFSCDGHEEGLSDPHPLTNEDRVEMESRRANWNSGVQGKGWVPPKPLKPRRRRRA